MNVAKTLFASLVALTPVLAVWAQMQEVPAPLAKGLEDPRAPLGMTNFEPYLSDVQSLSNAELKELHSSGRIDATIQLAKVLWWEGDTETPIDLLRLPAREGIPVAQYLLGGYLRYKRRDLPEASQWLLKAAEGGHPIAQETLAANYQFGNAGFPEDPASAFHYYLAAARQGLANAQMNVGIMYCKGKGVEMNKEQGKAWFMNSQQRAQQPLSLKSVACE